MKRVAWKASARRGRLLVREMERPDPGVFWLVVDASIELWAGRLGSAPLDRVVDEVATLSKHLLQSGSRVGLAVTAARLRSWIAPRSRASQSSRITDALLRASSAVDVDRSALGEPEVASLVAEHARPLEASPSRPVSADNLDALAARVEKLRARAPFPAEVPFAPTLRERSLRQHLTAFGIESPPRSSGEQAAADLTLGWALQEIAIGRPRPTVVHVWAPAPRSAQAVIRGLSVLRKKHVQIRWTLPPLEGFDVGGDPDAPGVILAAEVARMRARSARSRGEQALRRLGLRVGETRG